MKADAFCFAQWFLLKNVDNTKWKWIDKIIFDDGILIKTLFFAYAQHKPRSHFCQIHCVFDDLQSLHSYSTFFTQPNWKWSCPSKRTSWTACFAFLLSLEVLIGDDGPIVDSHRLTVRTVLYVTRPALTFLRNAGNFNNISPLQKQHWNQWVFRNEFVVVKYTHLLQPCRQNISINALLRTISLRLEMVVTHNTIHEIDSTHIAVIETKHRSEIKLSSKCHLKSMSEGMQKSLRFTYLYLLTKSLLSEVISIKKTITLEYFC